MHNIAYAYRGCELRGWSAGRVAAVSCPRPPKMTFWSVGRAVVSQLNQSRVRRNEETEQGNRIPAILVREWL
jgi:hypothetical protein